MLLGVPQALLGLEWGCVGLTLYLPLGISCCLPSWSRCGLVLQFWKCLRTYFLTSQPLWSFLGGTARA